MKSIVIIASILAAAIVSTSAVPAFAAKNNGAFQQSAEANHLQTACADWRLLFQENVKAMNSAKKGSKAYKDARAAANDMLGTAWSAGCSWAQ